MTIRIYLATLGLGAALAWTAIAVIVAAVSQPEVSRLIVGFLYAAIFFAVLGTAAVLGFALRAALLRRLPMANHVAVSFRQAALLGLLAVSALFLSSQRLLTMMTGLLLVVVLTIVEVVLIALGRRSARPPSAPKEAA